MNIKSLLLSCFSLLLVCFICAKADEVSALSDDQWPKIVKAEGIEFKVYQPQLDSWDGYTLKAHSAIGVQKAGNDNKISYGVSDFTFNTIVDKDTRLVKFDKIQLDSVKFPSEPEQEKTYLDDLRRAAPLQVKSISLDRLEANLQIVEQQKKGQSYELDNNPPKIIFSYKPAMLVEIDGDPDLSPLKDTNLSRVLNTHVLLLKDDKGKYYLHVFDGYMETTELNGLWTVSKEPPAGAKIAEERTQDVDLLEGGSDPETNKKPSLSGAQVPQIFVSTVPTELIVLNGEANYIPIKDTKLLYVSNTTANIFQDMAEKKVYVLISGRWFRSSFVTGPWEYVPAGKLPDDFAKIPDSDTKENVKASVPGTSQAQEALIANSVPTTSKIDRMEAKLVLEIDGAPQLKPIEGTPLFYVFNCSVPLIKVDDNNWYAVYNGIWFSSRDVKGPWSVADAVPAVIYSIPTNSPLHYVTYVKVYNSDSKYVYMGYTPGYYGTVVSPDGTVVYGTGYVYPSYVGSYGWYPPIDTYGFGTDLCWTPWYGWSFCFGFGWGYGPFWYYPPFPCWGPFFGWRHDMHFRFHTWEFSTALNGYNRFRGAPGHHAGFSDIGHFGRAYNSRTGIIIAGNSHSLRNVFRSPMPGFGRTGANRVVTNQPSRVTGQHVYGTANGHVYYYNDKHGGNWNHLNAQRGVSVPEQNREVEHLNQERGVRDVGEHRSNSSRQYIGGGGNGGNEGGGWGSHDGGSRGGGGGWHGR